MRRAFLSVVLAFALLVTLSTSAIHPAKADIEEYEWLGRQYHEYDPYWDWSGIRVYTEGSNTTLLVDVYNHYNVDLNVSAVKVLMDWNINYSSAECSEDAPFVMERRSWHVFTIIFTIPSTSVATNFMTHEYTIYVDEVNATGGPKEVTNFDQWRITRDDVVIYSTIQKEAMRLYSEIDHIFDTYGTDPGFVDVEAEDLWHSGREHYYTGQDSYLSGDFAGAKTQYETARGLLNQALSAGTTYMKDWQNYTDNYQRQMNALNITALEAMVSVYEAQGEAALIEANASMRKADAEMIIAEAQLALAQAAMTQAYAWIAFGIGFIIFGIAAVVWASRRPGSPSPT